MYKLLLSWRYLRTRYIALASIISVTLGVATLIVVNSVMSGFTNEMHKRLHGILSDLELTSTGLDHIYDPQWHMAEIEKVVGDDLEAMTVIVRVPAMLHFQFNGRTFTQQIMLIGVDETTYAEVSDIKSYLLHPENRERLRFMLKDNGYDQRLPPSGWDHRRKWVGAERQYQEELRRLQAQYDSNGAPPLTNESIGSQEPVNEPTFAPLPELPPELHAAVGEELSDRERSDSTDGQLFEKVDPFAAARPNGQPGETFDEMTEQHTGLILGVAITSMRRRNPETGEAEDVFFRLPGDNVQITLPSSGVPPQPISANFTIVDFYESKMHEYDSQFAFMPIDKLQQLRGMIDPQTGIGSVSSIQIKLKAGADLLAVKKLLQLRFPPRDYPYRVQTWQDIQGPLLSAVHLETTILNILLFLIITVAGFGILATFFMIVVEKTRDIGILKALGAPSRGVMSIFLTYGLSLGIVGSGAGIVLGLLFVTNINGVARLLERITGREVFDPTVYYFSEIPTIINPITIAWVAVGAISIAVMASILPAIRAARLHPVEALRYE
jgi:lipoprotein-releasing system permease protein